MTLTSDLDRQKSAAALTAAIERCNTALTSISSPNHISSNHDPAPDWTIIHRDLLSLLSLIHGSTTKLSLALKPSSPSYSASRSPLENISDQISAIAHCVCISGQDIGITLAQEVSSVVKNIINSVKALLQVFLDIEVNDNRGSTGQAGDEYMVRTGGVHDLINKAREPGGLSKDNFASVRKKLVENHGSLDDGLKELDEMVKDGQNLSDNEETWEDDGWAELGMSPDKKMNDSEIERAIKSYVVLRLSTQLHKRILKDVLRSPTTPSSDINRCLDTLSTHSSALLAASDELIATLYSPQSPPEIAAELALFLEIIQRLHSSLITLYHEPTLIEQLEGISLQGTTGPSKNWFEACVDQIQKAADGLRSTLHTQ